MDTTAWLTIDGQQPEVVFRTLIERFESDRKVKGWRWFDGGGSVRPQERSLEHDQSSDPHQVTLVEKRHGLVRWFEQGQPIGPHQAIAAVKRSWVGTGGEVITVQLMSQEGPTTRWVVISNCYPLFDWKHNQRNVSEVVDYLRDAEMSVDVGPLTAKRRLGGPLQIIGG